MGKLGWILIAISLILFSINFSPIITGNAISDNNPTFSILNIIAIALFIVSIFMLTSKKSLDVLIIPLGGKKQNNQRVKRALEEDRKRGVEYFLISGAKDTPEVKGTQRADIYGQLREYGIPPKRIKISGGYDTNENVELAIKRLKKMENINTVGIVSYPSHLDRFENAIEKNKSELPKEVEFERVETGQSTKQSVYGGLSKIYHKYLPKNNPVVKGVRKIIRKIIG